MYSLARRAHPGTGGSGRFPPFVGAYLHDKLRFRIPFERIDTEMAVMIYILDDERMVLPFRFENLENTASIWDEELVRRWFNVDKTKAFFYAPQVAAFQGKIKIFKREFETN